MQLCFQTRLICPLQSVTRIAAKTPIWMLGAFGVGVACGLDVGIIGMIAS